jgi:hypothetical protein
VAEQLQPERERAARRGARREVRVHRRAGEPRRGAVVAEQLLAGGRRRGRGQPGEVDRVAPQPQGEPHCRRHGRERRQPHLDHVVAPRGERADDRLPRAPGAGHRGLEARRGRVEVAVQGDRRAVGERMRHRDRRVHPLERLTHPEPVEPRRGERQRHEAGADVVHEARQRRLFRVHRPTGVAGLLEHGHRHAGAREAQRAHQAVVAGADDDRRAYAAA